MHHAFLRKCLNPHSCRPKGESAFYEYVLCPLSPPEATVESLISIFVIYKTQNTIYKSLLSNPLLYAPNIQIPFFWGQSLHCVEAFVFGSSHAFVGLWYWWSFWSTCQRGSVGEEFLTISVGDERGLYPKPECLETQKNAGKDDSNLCRLVGFPNQL